MRSEDGADLITERSEILQRWAEHYRTLLNCQRDVDMEVLQDFPRLETVHELDQSPTEREVGEALNSLKPGKSPGPDGILGEVLRLGGDTVTKCMFNFNTARWSGRLGEYLSSGRMLLVFIRGREIRQFVVIVGGSPCSPLVARSWQG